MYFFKDMLTFYDYTLNDLNYNMPMEFSWLLFV